MSAQQTVAEETGLSSAEQSARAAAAALWARRVLALMTVSNCDVRQALQAVEAAEPEETTR